MILIAVVDDDVEILESIKAFIMENYPNDFKIETFTSLESLDMARDSLEYHVYLLDIEIGTQNGVEYGKIIRNTNDDAFIIFITSYDKYALEGYDARPLSYLLKPVDTNKLKSLLDEILEKHLLEPRMIEIVENKKVNLIPVKDIISLEIKGRITLIKTRKDYFEVYESMKSILNRMDGELIKVNQSVYISPGYVETIIEDHAGRGVQLFNGERYFFSRDGYTKFLKEAARWSVKNK
ncbi:LytR/AlgR family response regulator transcription factor [Microaceticoccus formicicus]|uniref:LytR/AlgR family response regulator transcription factor n=1 Tax=Microaceticoccus formicicus TaxID=3118105 RepID=UPI003CD01822|nr:LytTR family DNA-binding domain-containing protein [Peptoniphilaceae bacterium AMB_02]